MLRYNIDYFLVREGQIFAYGWGFYSSSFVKNVILCVEFDSGSSIKVEAEYGRKRDDIRALFPDNNEAENTGFLLYAGFDGQAITRALLCWEIENHSTIEVQLDLTQDTDATKQGTFLKHHKLLFFKAISLLRSSGLRALKTKASRYLSNRPRTGNENDWKELCAKLRGKSLTIIVDHDMGGGANIYRKKNVKEICRTGDVVLLLGFHIVTLQFFIEVFNDNASNRFSIDSIDSLLLLASNGILHRIIYNCAVSFRQPSAVVNLLVMLKQQPGVELLVLVHDYFMICPSHFLINSENKFCGVPHVSQCNICLDNQRDGFVSMSGVRDIHIWRQTWATLLLAADEVRMFSESSKQLLKRAYPELPDMNWRVMPHELHTQLPRLQISNVTHLHIGVVGAVGKHKGAQVVSDLAYEILCRDMDVKITVIGTIEAKFPHGVVTVTGPYEANDLPELIMNSGANIFLFPSIWGETFSYLSHELVAMALPFACFDLGAQAELARRYEKGLVLSTMNVPDILDELGCFWKRIYQI